MSGDSIQECLEAIDKLWAFAGSEEDATLIADGILQRITEIDHATRLKWLTGDQSNTLEYEHLSDQVQLLNQKFKAAQLQSRANRRARWLERRQSWSKLPPAQQPLSTKSKTGDVAPEDLDPSVGVSEQVSASLRRIHQLAQAEVLRSEMNIEELQASSNALVDVQHKYSGVDMLLNGSRRLVKLLDQADTRDRRQMQLALAFLGAVLIWIIYRRVLKLPIKLLLWTLARVIGIARLFIPKTAAAAGTVLGETGVALSTVAATSVATSVATSAATGAATGAATSVATSVATGVATSVATSAATGAATSVATGAATSAATSVATSVATGVATGAAAITTTTATSLSSSLTSSLPEMPDLASLADLAHSLTLLASSLSSSKSARLASSSADPNIHIDL